MPINSSSVAPMYEHPTYGVPVKKGSKKAPVASTSKAPAKPKRRK